MDPQQVAESYEKIIQRFVQWSENEDNIRAAVVIGSRARQDHPADAWSDLDMLIYARNPEPLWAKTDWLRQMGEVWLSFLERTPDGGGYERRVMYAGGLDVDLVPSPATDLSHLAERPLPPDMEDILRRGVRVLVDKDGLLSRILNRDTPKRSNPPPSKEVFLNNVHDFWYHTVWTAKHLRRGELWWGKSCCDIYLKNLLRQMLEWHAQASSGGKTDTWMRGRFLEEWADPRAVAALSEAFAYYDQTDVWRALQATMQLYRWLSLETASQWGYSYPVDGADQVSALVNTLLTEI